jgi:hypothetical protein
MTLDSFGSKAYHGSYGVSDGGVECSDMYAARGGYGGYMPAVRGRFVPQARVPMYQSQESFEAPAMSDMGFMPEQSLNDQTQPVDLSRYEPLQRLVYSENGMRLNACVLESACGKQVRNVTEWFTGCSLSDFRRDFQGYGFRGGMRGGRGRGGQPRRGGFANQPNEDWRSRQLHDHVYGTAFTQKTGLSVIESALLKRQWADECKHDASMAWLTAGGNYAGLPNTDDGTMVEIISLLVRNGSNGCLGLDACLLGQDDMDELSVNVSFRCHDEVAVTGHDVEGARPLSSPSRVCNGRGVRGTEAEGRVVVPHAGPRVSGVAGPAEEGGRQVSCATWNDGQCECEQQLCGFRDGQGYGIQGSWDTSSCTARCSGCLGVHGAEGAEGSQSGRRGGRGFGCTDRGSAAQEGTYGANRGAGSRIGSSVQCDSRVYGKYGFDDGCFGHWFGQCGSSTAYPSCAQNVPCEPEARVAQSQGQTENTQVGWSQSMNILFLRLQQLTQCSGFVRDLEVVSSFSQGYSTCCHFLLLVLRKIGFGSASMVSSVEYGAVIRLWFRLKKCISKALSQQRIHWAQLIVLIRLKAVTALVKMVCNPNARSWNRSLLNILKNIPQNWYEMYDGKNRSMVYMICSQETSLRYFGETKRNIKQRYHGELMDALHIMRSKGKKGKRTRLAKAMAALKPESFDVYPVYDAYMADKFERLKLEQWFIRTYEAGLNMSGRRNERKHGGVRRIFVARENKGARRRVSAPARFMREGVPEMFYTLEHLLERAKENEVVRLVRTSGDVGLSDFRFVAKRWGDSRVTEVNGEVRHLQLRSALKLLREKRDEEVHMLIHVKRAAWNVGIDEVVNAIKKKRLAKARWLRKCTTTQLVEVWARANKTLKGMEKKLATQTLRGWMRKRLGKEGLRVPMVRIVELEDVSKSQVKEWMHRVIDKARLPNLVREWMKQDMTVVTIRRKQIKQRLVSNRRFAKDGTMRAVCTCGQRDHLCQRMAEMNGELKMVGKRNASESVRPTGLENKRHIMDALTNAVAAVYDVFMACKADANVQQSMCARDDLAGMVQEMTEDMDGAESLCALAEDMMVRGSQVKEEAYSGELTESVLRRVQTKIRETGLIVARIDKNPNQLVVECPMKTIERLNECFMENKNFEKVQVPRKELLSSIEDDYCREGFNKLVKWKKGGELPYAYADPKNKDLNKSRGIVSYCKHPAKRLFKVVSKACMWLLMQMPEKELGFTMKKLDDLKRRVAEMERTVQEDRKEGEQPTLEVLQFDIDSMYTNLDSDQIREAVMWFIDTARSTVVPRAYRNTGKMAVDYRLKKDGIRFGVAEGKSEVQLDFQTIMNVVLFDLEHLYLQVRGQCYKQKKGVPIGGFLGAFYAIVQCAKAESDFKKKLEDKQGVLQALRYIDDEIICVATYHGEEGERSGEKEKGELLTNVYRGGLSVKMVSVEGKKGEAQAAVFVGAAVRTNGVDRIWVEPYNKNLNELLVKGKQKVVMFRSDLAYYNNPRAAYGSVVGAMCRMQRNCSEDEESRRALIKVALLTIVEMVHCGIRTSTIRKALKTMRSKAKGNWRRTWDAVVRESWKSMLKLPLGTNEENKSIYDE